MFSREAQARAIRYAAVLFVLYVAGAWVYLASGQPKAAELVDRMPKDQKAFIADVEAHQRTGQRARDAVGLVQAELHEEYRKQQKSLLFDLTRKLQNGEVKGWVGVCASLATDEVTISVPDRLNLVLEYKGMPEKIKAVVRTLSVGDVVVVTAHTGIRPDVQVRNARVGAAVPGKSVLAIEKQR